jgi:hypothetical protein
VHGLSSPPPRQDQANAEQRRTHIIRCADCGLRVRARAPWKRFCAACRQAHNNRIYVERYWRDRQWRETLKASKRREWRDNPKKRERQYRRRRLRSARRRQATRGVVS